MSVPLPDKSLSGHCSVIDSNTLYVLSSNSFQALPLKENATWTSMTMGTSVTNPTCLRAVPNGNSSQAALYVIGGESDDDGYGGLQRYVFSEKSWETLSLPTKDMQGRTNHGAAYLDDSSSILVYAGSQASAPSELSSQTFLISTEEPYNIQSFNSKAPPVSSPILLAWNSSSAVMTGGSETNTDIWTFSASGGWSKFDTSLTDALSTSAQGAIITGSDGSKVLSVYDASVSPNEVTQLVLLGANGEAATTGQTVGSSSSKSSSRKRKRDLTLADWPTYNSSSAPSVKRSDYSVAQNDQGTLAVISGGNDENPVNVFNLTSNSWVSNEVFFGGSQVPLTSASASSSAALSTSTNSQAAATSSAAASSSDSSSDNGAHLRTVLGAVFGTLAGVAVILIIALLFMRRRKQKRAGQHRGADEKDADRMSFQDRGASFMKEAGGSVSSAPVLPSPVPQFNNGYDPRSSFAILAGKLGADRFSQRFSNYSGADKAVNNHPYAGLEPPKNVYGNDNGSSSSLAIISNKYKHNRGNGEKGSFESTAKLVRSPKSPQSFDDPMELESMDGQTPRLAQVQSSEVSPVTIRTVPSGQTDEQQKKRSSGWSRYFANQNDGGVYDPAEQNASSLSVSEYSASRNPSAVVPPLDVEPSRRLHPADAQRLSVVPNGRPSFSHSVEDFAARGASLDMARGQSADFHTGQSLESQGYLNNTRESFASSRRHSMSSVASSQFFAHHDDSWTPVAGVATSVNNSLPNSPAIREVQIPPSPAVSASHFPRPPSSSYTADPYDRDSRMTEFRSMASPNTPGSALSPPAAVAIPGPAARANGGGGSGFFPGSGTRALYERPGTARKIGHLHPGTLAALRFSPDSPKEPPKQGLGIVGADDGNRDSSATIWPSAGSNTGSMIMAQKDREAAFRERLERERLQKQQMDNSVGARKTQASDISWVDIGQ